MPEQNPTTQTPSGTKVLKHALKSAGQIPAHLGNRAEVQAVAQQYRMSIPTHYLGLMQSADDPIARQAVPSLQELEEDGLPEDPYLEDDPRYSPSPHLTWRYPDRALLLVTEQCPMYCRYCMRKRVTQREEKVRWSHIQQAIGFIATQPAIREVILSGGDPLMLSDSRLQRILQALRTIRHVEVLRIHTRMPAVNPQRINRNLAELLGRFQPLYVVSHFNHPRELAPAATSALALLADAGVPLANQSVLLKGVNDNAEVLKELFLGLLKHRVQPYYLHQGDLVHGTNHFRTRVETGLNIMRELQGKISGLALPQYVVDGPGGGGKVPLWPNPPKVHEDFVEFLNVDGQKVRYPQVQD